MKSRLELIVALVILGMSLPILSACGGTKAAEVGVTLKEWSITPEITQVRAGKVKFVATNTGIEPHEFVVIKSDLDPASLPVVDGKVDEERVEIIDEIEPWAPGETLTMTVNLKAGRYILICNIVERVPGQPVESHYLQGMRMAFGVFE